MKSLSLEEYRPSLLLELFQSSGQVNLAVAPQSPATPAYQTYSFISDYVNIWKIPQYPLRLLVITVLDIRRRNKHIKWRFLKALALLLLQLRLALLFMT